MLGLEQTTKLNDLQYFTVFYTIQVTVLHKIVPQRAWKLVHIHSKSLMCSHGTMANNLVTLLLKMYNMSSGNYDLIPLL